MSLAGTISLPSNRIGNLLIDSTRLPNNGMALDRSICSRLSFTRSTFFTVDQISRYPLNMYRASELFLLVSSIASESIDTLSRPSLALDSTVTTPEQLMSVFSVIASCIPSRMQSILFLFLIYLVAASILSS